MINNRVKVIIAGVCLVGIIGVISVIGYNSYETSKVKSVISVSTDAMNKGDYNSALYQLGSVKSTEATALKNDIINYKDAYALMSKGDLDGAIAKLNSIDTSKDSNLNDFNIQVNNLKSSIDNIKKEEDKNGKVLVSVQNDIKAGRYQTAQNSLNDLNGNKFLSANQKDQITKLNTEIKDAQDKAASDARAAMDAEAKKDKEAEAAKASKSDSYTFPLTQDECMSVLESKLPGTFGYFGSTGVQATEILIFTHNQDGVNGGHVMVNTDNGTIYDEDYNIISGPIK